MAIFNPDPQDLERELMLQQLNRPRPYEAGGVTGGAAVRGQRNQSTPGGSVPGFGDHIQALSIYDTSEMTDAQRTQMQQDTAARHARDQAGAERDRQYLASRNGQSPEPGYQFYKPEGADPSARDYGGKLVGGSLFDEQQAGTGTSSTDAAAGTAGGTRGKYRGQLQGFNFDKLDNQKEYGSHPKYAFADIAQDYPDTPDGLAAMAKDPRFASAGFKYLGKDKIQVPNGSVIDVGLSFGDGGGKGWAWQPVSGPDAAQNGPAAGSAAGPRSIDGPSSIGGIQSLMPTDTDFFNRLQAKIQEILGPGAVNRDTLLKMLTGGK